MAIACDDKVSNVFSALTGGESDEIHLDINRTFLVVFVSGWKVVSQFCKDPETNRSKIDPNIWIVLYEFSVT